MNAPHWHLAINHIPVVGMLIAVILLGYALLRGRGELYGVGLGILVLLALATVPVYLTGHRADDSLMDVQDIDEHFVGAHMKAAYIAAIGVWVLGFLALVVMWIWRKAPVISRGAVGAMFVLGVIEAGLMARTANLGGEIRHPEIRAVRAPTATPAAKGEKE